MREKDRDVGPPLVMVFMAGIGGCVHLVCFCGCVICGATLFYFLLAHQQLQQGEVFAERLGENSNAHTTQDLELTHNSQRQKARSCCGCACESEIIMIIDCHIPLPRTVVMVFPCIVDP